MLTAAHCIYSHEDKAWLEEVMYVPSLNGSTGDDAPFGAYAYESLNVVEGYVTNYKGGYDSVVPWDLGIITLVDPIGNNLGYLPGSNYDDLGDFTANIVGYPGDKPMGTMWRTTCDVLAESIGADIFTYDCDTYPGSSGSSVYFYDSRQQAAHHHRRERCRERADEPRCPPQRDLHRLDQRSLEVGSSSRLSFGRPRN